MSPLKASTCERARCPVARLHLQRFGGSSCATLGQRVFPPIRPSLSLPRVFSNCNRQDGCNNRPSEATRGSARRFTAARSPPRFATDHRVRFSIKQRPFSLSSLSPRRSQSISPYLRSFIHASHRFAVPFYHRSVLAIVWIKKFYNGIQLCQFYFPDTIWTQP